MGPQDEKQQNLSIRHIGGLSCAIFAIFAGVAGLMCDSSVVYNHAFLWYTRGIMVGEQDFIRSVERFAEEIWQKYGPAAYASKEAYNELKQSVRFSSWIVSPSHCKRVSEFTRAVTSERSLLSSFDQAVQGMTEMVWRRIQQIISDNAVSYFCVHFPDQSRYLTYEDIRGTPAQSIHSVRFPDSIGAEEAAEDFCKAYILAGINPPAISIVAFNSQDGEIPCSKAFKPSTLMKSVAFLGNKLRHMK